MNPNNENQAVPQPPSSPEPVSAPQPNSQNTAPPPPATPAPQPAAPLPQPTMASPQPAPLATKKPINKPAFIVMFLGIGLFAIGTFAKIDLLGLFGALIWLGASMVTFNERKKNKGQ